ncbi:FAD-dependent monooxygenase [Chondromyces apiculatus]|uniref:2-polyprenyl-6-methoxyphenol hydroxylase and FAD-dependent oxidoreductase n=1 Tax=Chondromyces apiculatus DSM 436 TaxID=1192034 RepID=A0A017STZ1_9BACT|nr:FAD-dependent monooxygenase [Chondromyces apiculatus]EYF00247.1 2-polyprenyl-6-methoxyphenol hydroxylase and FAD-dependent oxidoreductase [Chondromyces apiculatus DSM 436]
MLDALVVGAGPVGLTMGAELTRHGARCRVIETVQVPSRWSKAQAIHARTLEVLDNEGVAEELVAWGEPVHGVSCYAPPDPERLYRISLEGIPSPFPYVLSLSQRETEKTLEAQLKRIHGLGVERQVRLDAFTQDADGVTAMAVHADGTREEIRAAYLLGCDGAHSTVREGLGFTLEGKTYPIRLLQADLRVDTDVPLPRDEIATFVSPGAFLVLFPMPGNSHFRVIIVENTESSAMPLPVTLETFQDFVREHGPRGAHVRDPEWMIDFRIHCRVVRRFRDGRVFLAGDAAHIHSPIGGQGMNLGIQDACNLAWKLALVRTGGARESLLDSYEIERRPLAEATLKGTDRATQGMLTALKMKRPWMIDALTSVLTPVVQLDAVQAKARRTLSMLGAAYRDSPAVGEDHTGRWKVRSPFASIDARPDLASWRRFREGPEPGTRVPDVVLDSLEGGAVRLFDILRGTQHTLLLFAGVSPTEEVLQGLLHVAHVASSRCGERLRIHLVLPRWTLPTDLPRGTSMILDPEGPLHRAFGAYSSCLHVVRPDGYLGYRCQPADAERLGAWLDRIFT